MQAKKNPETTPSTPNTPLAGFRVLDMSRVLAGPWTGQILADLGAEVIKVERPQTGDDTRQWGPPFLDNQHGDDTESAYYLAANRGKKSITIDITQPEGQALIRQLAGKVDVLVENFKVGGLEKYGLDYPSLQPLNPQLVYCSITGFGQTGPYARRPGYDFLIQAMGGLMSITGQPDGSPGAEPVKVGVAITDLVTGLYAAIAIQGALLERVQSGLGQHIDLALLDTSAAILANQATNYLVGHQVPRRLGNAHPNIVPYQAFATADGHIIIAVGNDKQFANLCRLLGIPELATDPRANTNPQRVKHREFVIEQLAPAMQQHTSEALLSACEQADVPCGPINTIEQTFDDPSILARGMRLSLQHPHNDDLQLPGNPIKMSRNQLVQNHPPPLLGQHTREVLRTLLDCDAETLQKLADKQVI
ncbi:CoA transferase [Exilibacterium tricleocarpae]|uniref:CoA transferase n=1 Tax=Exilibacterium tricleocarpae TaxID=2591008 RepID=A0A545U5C7_9GAMM|nr:CaiB/BaiF CoA-transferase family protein [Exilibacterium tricleocarpae]TQV84671.1 CoA transferase [Exilibacterium tricleocarpae]